MLAMMSITVALASSFAQHHHVALHHVFERGELRGGHEMERGGHVRAPEQRLDLGRHRSVRRKAPH